MHTHTTGTGRTGTCCSEPRRDDDPPGGIRDWAHMPLAIDRSENDSRSRPSVGGCRRRCVRSLLPVGDQFRASLMRRAPRGPYRVPLPEDLIPGWREVPR